MQTIKTAVVVVLLLVVLYGAYIAINGANTDLPPELQIMLDSEANLDVDVSMSGSTPFSGGSSTDGFPSSLSSNTLSNGGGLKPAAIPTFGGPAPSFDNKPGTASSSQSNLLSSPPSSLGTLAPPQLASIPSAPLPTQDNPFPASGSSGNAIPKPLANSTSPKLASSPSTLDIPSADSDSFGLNVGGNSKAPTSFDSPPPFGTPVASKGNENKLATSASNTSSGINSVPSIESSPTDVGGAVSTSTDSGPNGGRKANLTGRSYESAKQVAMENINRGEFKEALATLSVFYGSPELSETQSKDLIDLLDSLAGETIYSRRHLLDTPYVVGPGETIDMVAKKFEIPAELLARINAVETTGNLMPGNKLKVFQGPFRAEVDMKRNEMTVFLGELYAGRFPCSTGADPVPKEGVFQVLDKQRNRNYYGLGGAQIDGNDPRNPYGGWWIDLGEDVSIHGTAVSGGPENAKLGCISLSPLDAGDVYSMLSRGSQVTIKR